NRFLIGFAIGDIEVSGDVTAVTQRRAANLDVFSIWPLSFVDIGRSVSSHFEPRVDLLLDVACAVFSTIGVETIKSFARQRAILEQLAWVVHQLLLLFVAKNQAMILVDDRDAAREISNNSLQESRAFLQFDMERHRHGDIDLDRQVSLRPAIPAFEGND